MPSGLFRKFRALSIARPNRARQATSRSWISGWMWTSATWSKTSGETVRRPTSVVPARAPSITWSERSSVKTSESKRGDVMTSVSRSSTLSSMPPSARADAMCRISSLKRNCSSWSRTGSLDITPKAYAMPRAWPLPEQMSARWRPLCLRHRHRSVGHDPADRDTARGCVTGQMDHEAGHADCNPGDRRCTPRGLHGRNHERGRPKWDCRCNRHAARTSRNEGSATGSIEPQAALDLQRKPIAVEVAEVTAEVVGRIRFALDADGIRHGCLGRASLPVHAFLAGAPHPLVESLRQDADVRGGQAGDVLHLD